MIGVTKTRLAAVLHWLGFLLVSVGTFYSVYIVVTEPAFGFIGLAFLSYPTVVVGHFTVLISYFLLKYKPSSSVEKIEVILIWITVMTLVYTVAKAIL